MNQVINKNSTESAYHRILHGILDFTLKPGEVVTEIDLSNRLGLSRTPIREAIKKLENEGLIITQNRVKKINFLTEKDIEEIFDVKIALESLIAGQASERGTEEQMNALSNVIIEIRQLIEKKQQEAYQSDEDFFSDWLKTDEKFHALLFEMSGNKRAELIIHTLNNQWHRIKVGLSAIEGRTEKSAGEHENIGNAVILRDAEAAGMAVRNHLENLRTMLLKLMKTFHY